MKDLMPELPEFERKYPEYKKGRVQKAMTLMGEEMGKAGQ